MIKTAATLNILRLEHNKGASTKPHSAGGRNLKLCAKQDSTDKPHSSDLGGLINLKNSHSS